MNEKQYCVIDGHCDTVCELMKRGENLEQNDLCVSLLSMKKYKSYIQFFALFVNDETETPFQRVNELLRFYQNQLTQFQKEIVPVRSACDFEAVLSKGQIGAMLTLENGRSLEGNIKNLYFLYEQGARALGLTWNGANELCDGIGVEEGGGLTAFGREVVSTMNELGMIVDVSHISERGFWDVLRESKQPVMATHSNSKTICGHKRNLTDEQIRALSEKGGVMGLNLYPDFLAYDAKTVGWEDCIRHIKQIISVGGEDCIALGSDFDGFPQPMPVG
ncbi:MAG: membrane dipeptidase, partial [Ruminococcaceae bacterium]|nr:membrane dipeptidase [Oscillospiraceae bacterium]